jgi:PDZ domain
MKHAAIPLPLLDVIETARTSALASYDVLDTPASPHFDQMAEFVARSLGTAIALISFIDRDRQWVKASAGMHVVELPRHLSFCHHAIATDTGTLVVPDTLADVRFNRHPFVQGAPFIRFYAGVALADREGYRLGTVSVIGQQPGELTTANGELLRGVAGRVVDLLVLGRARAGQGGIEALHSAGRPIAGPASHSTGDRIPMAAVPLELTGVAAPRSLPSSLVALNSAAFVDREVPPPGRGWLGVKTELARPLPGSGDVGRLIVRIARNSPAERVGLKVGDVLLAIDRQLTRRGSDIVTAMACCAIGEQAELRLWRSGKVMQMVIRVEAALSSQPDRLLPAALPGKHGSNLVR